MNLVIVAPPLVSLWELLPPKKNECEKKSPNVVKYPRPAVQTYKEPIVIHTKRT
jgi:hypothetical protein